MIPAFQVADWPDHKHECPALVWVAPEPPAGGVFSALSRLTPSNWLTDTMVLYFVCPFTLAIVPCGPGGKGFKIKKAKATVSNVKKESTLAMMV